MRLRPSADLIEHGKLLEILEYDAETGIFTWRRRMANHLAGTRAGGAPDPKRDYRLIRIEKISYYEHRLAWFYVTGQWPAQEVDHINGDAGDNRLANLREATSSDNKCNRLASVKSVSGKKGVCLDRRRGTWSAEICRKGVRVRRSGFATAEDAAAVYVAMAAELHGEFARYA